MTFLQFGYASMMSYRWRPSGRDEPLRCSSCTGTLWPPPLWHRSRCGLMSSKVRPKMTLRIFLKIVALALLEPVLDQNLSYMGAKATSASFVAALYNILPALTFLLAILLRMEKIKMKSLRTQAKIAGTLITVAGALLMILYKGPVVDFLWSKGRSHRINANVASQDESHWLMGTILLLLSCLSWSCFFVLQAYTLRSYPAALSLTTLICSMGALLSGAVALVMEHSMQPWIIGWDSRLLTAVYSGVMCSGIAYFVEGIVMKERGPVFVTAFSPLCMIIAAALGSVFLAEKITLGRAIGAGIIVIGLYLLIWGKSKDHQIQCEENINKKNVIQSPEDNNEKMLGLKLPMTTLDVEIPPVIAKD
ncbi:WAT1-related protein At2g37460-like isoform X1 [Asparagus officinalis]|uniref:WAT1-related protein At2g37460-like isoform X1 n=2 Tax=Asparagus officinalis TaxID=4686 RepID=UPI00098E4CE7|nr:WAT1-related protein At2g37460-like isoform X1 [Asparagus officinalis]